MIIICYFTITFFRRPSNAKKRHDAGEAIHMRGTLQLKYQCIRMWWARLLLLLSMCEVGGSADGWCTCSTLKWKVVMPATWRLGVVPSCCVCMWSTSFFFFSFSKVLLQAQSTCHFPHGGWRRRALIRKIMVAFLILSSKCFLTGCRAVLLTKFSLFQLTSLILTPRLWYPC